MKALSMFSTCDMGTIDTDNSGARSKLPTASMMKIDHRRGQYLKHDRKRPRSTSGGSVPSAPTAPPTP